jgi:hypothetical protein
MVMFVFELINVSLLKYLKYILVKERPIAIKWPEAADSLSIYQYITFLHSEARFEGESHESKSLNR